MLFYLPTIQIPYKSISLCKIPNTRDWELGWPCVNYEPRCFVAEHRLFKNMLWCCPSDDHPKKDIALMATSFWKTVKTVQNLAENPCLTVETCLNLVNFLLGCDQICKHLQLVFLSRFTPRRNAWGVPQYTWTINFHQWWLQRKQWQRNSHKIQVWKINLT